MQAPPSRVADVPVSSLASAEEADSSPSGERRRVLGFHVGPYALALLITFMGLLLRFALDPWLGDQMPYITFELAVAVTGLFVGVRPALLSTIAGAALAYFPFVEPRYRWGFNGISDAAGFAVYLLVALAIVALIRARSEATDVAQRSLLERMEAQRSLADAQALLKAFLDNSPACAYLQDADGHNVYTNETAARVLREWLSSSGREQTDRHEEVLRTGRAMSFVRKIDSGNEERYWLTINFPFVDQAGCRFVGSNLFDITDRMRAEEGLRKTERLVAAGQMASVVAHEINNPLAGATNSLFLLGSEALSAEGQRYLKLAEEELARVSHITSLTLSLYKEHESLSAIRIEKIVDDVVNALAPDAASRNIHILRDYRCEASIVAREDRIHSLLHNLISNALESGAKSVKIRVAAGRDWEDIRRTGFRISVIDDGWGIPPENRERLFRPFFTTKEQKGAGLGLWASKVIVLRNGGSIRVRTSTRPSRRGTRVTVFLPSIVVGRRPVSSDNLQMPDEEDVA